MTGWPAGFGVSYLTADRLRGYPRLFLGVYAMASVVWVCLSHNLIDPSGKPLGFDFITFWGASWLAEHGQAAAAYAPLRLWAVQLMAVAGTPQPYLWHYPPPFFLAIYPLGWLPYVAAYSVFILGSLALYLFAIGRMFPGRLWLLAALPAVMLVVLHGQATFLLVAVVAGGCMLLDRRPIAAGLLLGLLVCKPHLALLFPIAMVASGRWRTLAGMAASVILLILASIFAFGMAPWADFVGDLPLARRVLEEGMLPWDTMPTVFAASRMLGLPVRAAYAGQSAIALAVIVLIAWLWRGTADQPRKLAALMVGSLLISPYAFDYDLLLLAIPIGLLAHRQAMLQSRFLFPLLAAAALMPIALPPLAKATSLQLMPVVLLALFGYIVAKTSSPCSRTTTKKS